MIAVNQLRCLAIAWCLTVVADAAEAPVTTDWSLSVRPLAAIGLTTVGSYTRGENIPLGVATLVGLRAMVSPRPMWSFGLEGDWLSTGLEADEGLRRAWLLGPVTELRLWNVVHVSAGISLAHDLGAAQRNYADISVAAGFEPWSEQAWSPFIVYRSDVITTTSITSVRMVQIGIRAIF